MDEYNSLVASEEVKAEEDESYSPKTIKDSDVLYCLEDKPICNLCVQRYRRLAVAVYEDDSSEDEAAAAKASKSGDQSKKPAAKQKKGGADGDKAISAETPKPKRKKEKKNNQLTVLDLTTHPVSERVPWNHVAEYPGEQLTVKEFITKSQAGDQNYPLTLLVASVGIKKSDGTFLDGKLNVTMPFASYNHLLI